MRKATFGAGCFWGVEAAFAAIPGVTATAVGYEGGSLERPSYKDVCTSQTGHAEVVELEFDPAQVSFEQLLDAFFALHDPTTLNRQGPDWGPQYRSAIFFHTPAQEARGPRQDRAAHWRRPVQNRSASSPWSKPPRPSGAPRSITSATWRSGGRQAAISSWTAFSCQFSVVGDQRKKSQQGSPDLLLDGRDRRSRFDAYWLF